MTLRILGGELKGQSFALPQGGETRPITAMLRKSLFDMLQNAIPESRILDLFAGSGAIGIEALSRGASFAHFIDLSSPAIRCLKGNIEKLQLKEFATIEQKDAFVFLASYKGTPFDLLFLDPPYPFGLEGYTRILENLKPPLFHEESRIILELPGQLLPKILPTILEKFEVVKEKKNSTTALLILRAL
jgi:16S rRNA (guanine966-N2)-methyltransferase